MAENDEVAVALARLEAALARIAAAAAAERPRAPEEPGPETAEIAARLDEIIAEVRSALAGAPVKEPA